MVDEYDCELTELNEEWICDHPNADNKNVTEKVGMTPNPAYDTVNFSEGCVSSKPSYT